MPEGVFSQIMFERDQCQFPSSLRCYFSIVQSVAGSASRYGECDDNQRCCDGEGDSQSAGNGLGGRRRDVSCCRCEGEHSTHDGCTRDQPQIA